MGYLPLSRALLICSSSLHSSCVLEYTVLALCSRKVVLAVPMEVLVCVHGFPTYRGELCVVRSWGNQNVPVRNGVISVGTSVVNCIFGSTDVMWHKACWLCYACWMKKAPSTYLSQSLGGLGKVVMALDSNSSMNRLHDTGNKELFYAIFKEST